MRSRLNDDPGRSAEALRSGRPLSVSDQRLLAGLSGAESRILGSAQLGKLRDLSVGLLRVTTLLGAVLLVPLKEPVQNPTSTQNDSSTISTTQPAHVTLQPIYDPPGTTSSEGKPVTLNVNFNERQAQQSGATGASTIVQVIDRKPLYLESEATVVIGSGAGYWYRSVLGEGDYFWALPDGDFNFTVNRWISCNSGTICAVLKFSFDSGSGEQTIRTGNVSFPKNRAQTGRVVGSGNANKFCNQQLGSANKHITRCRYPSGGGRELIVDVKASATEATAEEHEAGKSAFDVRWCWTHPDPNRSICPIPFP